jgi:hypothetical protein
MNGIRLKVATEGLTCATQRPARHPPTYLLQAQSKPHCTTNLNDTPAAHTPHTHVYTHTCCRPAAPAQHPRTSTLQNSPSPSHAHPPLHTTVSRSTRTCCRRSQSPTAQQTGTRPLHTHTPAGVPPLHTHAPAAGAVKAPLHNSPQQHRFVVTPAQQPCSMPPPPPPTPPRAHVPNPPTEHPAGKRSPPTLQAQYHPPNTPAAGAVKAPLLLQLCLPAGCRCKQLGAQVAQAQLGGRRDVTGSTHNLWNSSAGQQAAEYVRSHTNSFRSKYACLQLGKQSNLQIHCTRSLQSHA